MRRRLPLSHLSAENSGNKDFSETLAQVRVPEMQKSDEARFFGKNPFLVFFSVFWCFLVFLAESALRIYFFYFFFSFFCAES